MYLRLSWLLALGLLIWISSGQCWAQQTGMPSASLAESLSEEANDPTATLTQAQIQEFFTPSQYGTNAQPNTLQGQVRPRGSPTRPAESCTDCETHVFPGYHPSKQRRVDPHRIWRLATLRSICDAAVDDGRDRFQVGNRTLLCLSHCDFEVGR
jgi:hypothetical protein